VTIRFSRKTLLHGVSQSVSQLSLNISDYDCYNLEQSQIITTNCTSFQSWTTNHVQIHTFISSKVCRGLCQSSLFFQSSSFNTTVFHN